MFGMIEMKQPKHLNNNNRKSIPTYMNKAQRKKDYAKKE